MGNKKNQWIDGEFTDEQLNALYNEYMVKYMVRDREKGTLYDYQTKYIKMILNEKKDVFAQLPTGSGKSTIFQLAGLMLNEMYGGICLVVSPLVALIEDQVSKLKGMHKRFAPEIASRYFVGKCNRNSIKSSGFLYITPEGMCRADFIDLFLKLDINLIVIDEAHCVSLWGYDFRPRYLEIRTLLKMRERTWKGPKEKTRPIIAAFTATSTNDIRKDVIDVLQMNCDGGENGCGNTAKFQSRENLKIRICPNTIEDFEKKKREYYNEYGPDPVAPMKAEWECREGMVAGILRKEILESELKENSCGVVFCRTTDEVDFLYDRICEMLKVGDDYVLEKYYAALGRKDRKERLERYLNCKRGIMVATSAFGMGIDKEGSAISYVIHYGIPYSIEDYYQQIGRAARKEGTEATCYILYTKGGYGARDRKNGNQKSTAIIREEIARTIINGFGGKMEDDATVYMNRKMQEYFSFFDIRIALMMKRGNHKAYWKSKTNEKNTTAEKGREPMKVPGRFENSKNIRDVIFSLKKNHYIPTPENVKKGLFCAGYYKTLSLEDGEIEREIDREKNADKDPDKLYREMTFYTRECKRIERLEKENEIRMADLDRAPIIYCHRSPVASKLEKGIVEGNATIEKVKKKTYDENGKWTMAKSEKKLWFQVVYKDGNNRYEGNAIPYNYRPVYLDMMIIDVVYTLEKYRQPIHLDSIIRTMFCSDELRVNPKRKETVEKRIEILLNTSVQFSMGIVSSDDEKRFVKEEYLYEEPLLPLVVKETCDGKTEYEFEDRNGQKQESILTKWDIEKNTFFTIPCSVIHCGLEAVTQSGKTKGKSGKNSSFEKLILVYYLYKRINMYTSLKREDPSVDSSYRMHSVSNVIRIRDDWKEVPIFNLFAGISSIADKLSAKTGDVRPSEMKRALINIENIIYDILDEFKKREIIAGFTPADMVIKIHEKYVPLDKRNVPLLTAPKRNMVHDRILFYPNARKKDENPYVYHVMEGETPFRELQTIDEMLDMAYNDYAIEEDGQKYLPDFMIKRIFDLSISISPEKNDEESRFINQLPSFVENDPRVIKLELRHFNALKKRLSRVKSSKDNKKSQLDVSLVSDIHSKYGFHNVDVYAFNREFLKDAFNRHREYIEERYKILVVFDKTENKIGKLKDSWHIRFCRMNHNPIVWDVIMSQNEQKTLDDVRKLPGFWILWQKCTKNK